MHQSWDNGGIRENTQITEKTGICLISLYENISFFQTHEKEVGLASGYLTLNCLMLTLLMHIQNHVKHLRWSFREIINSIRLNISLLCNSVLCDPISKLKKSFKNLLLISFMIQRLMYATFQIYWPWYFRGFRDNRPFKSLINRIFKVGMICSMFIHCFVFYIGVTKAAFT